MITLVLASFLIVAALSTVGLFYEGYRENWLQAIGLVILATSSTILFAKSVDADHVRGDMASFAIGAALFMCGIATKVWKHRRENMGQSEGSGA